MVYTCAQFVINQKVDFTGWLFESRFPCDINLCIILSGCAIDNLLRAAADMALVIPFGCSHSYFQPYVWIVFTNDFQ